MTTLPPDDSRDADAIDPGEALRELADFAEMPGAGFVDRIVNAVDRRVMGAEVVDFTCGVLRLTLAEYWSMLVSTLNPKKRTED